MARTAAGASLTEAHRQGQLQIRAQALRQYALAWPLWTGDGKSFDQLLELTASIVAANRAASAGLAASYYEIFRTAERPGGAPTPRIADVLPDREVRGTLFRTGLEMTRNAIAAGQSPDAARQSALVRTSGTVTRFVLNGGRDTVVRSAGEDPKAGGWARVTDGQPCAFCALLSGRGPVFSADTVAFKAHDHCACGAEPHYQGAAWPGRAEEFKRMYDEAQRAARESGDGSTGTSNDLLNNFRRFYAQKTAA